jgi:Sulfotransferase family
VKADYGLVDRLLHRIALGSSATAEIFHELERSRYLSDAPEDRGRHVFVTGLARAGTTILLRELYASGQFGSLLYADMPFVLAPNLWAGISRGARRPFAAIERDHGDGIAVNLDSPEAFDEVFWRIFYGKSYIRDDGLLPHRPSAQAISRYRDHIRLVLRRRAKSRYLTKCNNNILRLGTLAGAMPDCTFLLVIRAPLTHADSLLRQHHRSAQSTDRFRRDYVRWLAHHEFGIDHRPFLFAGRPVGDPNEFDYWLATWLACYLALEPIVEAYPNVWVIPYERICSEPQTWTALCQRIGIEAAGRREIHTVASKAAGPADGPLATAAHTLHARYLEHAQAWLPSSSL